MLSPMACNNSLDLDQVRYKVLSDLNKIFLALRRGQTVYICFSLYLCELYIVLLDFSLTVKARLMNA